MREREPDKEAIGKGELYYLYHPGTEDTFSGYGLTIVDGKKDRLSGLLMVDRPHHADQAWLERIGDTFGECRLVQMTDTGDRGLACQMKIGNNSVKHLRQFPSEIFQALKTALDPLLEEPPAPILNLHWDKESQLWRSGFAMPNELPPEICEVFENTGYGCLAAETNIGVVHVCHASDSDIDGFGDKPVSYQWQIVKMPSAPLIRLEIVILDRPENPYRFESFLNVDAEDQSDILRQLANQDRLYLAFYDDQLDYRFTKILPHDKQQWQKLDEIWEHADAHLADIAPEQRDFDLAKAEFMSGVE